MKINKYLMIGLLWFSILSISVSSKSEMVSFQIQYDSTTPQDYEMKNEVLRRYSDLIRGVHEDSITTLLIHNLDVFMWDDDMLADFSQNVLHITIGDGKGALIRGDLEANSICFPEVKPKSFFAEFFQ